MSSRPAALLTLSGLIILVVLCVLGPVWFGSNFRTVIADRVYRSGELRAPALARAIDDHHLRSLVNLRGREEGREWYEEELRIARERGLVRYDLDFSARALPPRPAVVELIHVLRAAPEPILLHCSAGADRTGFASVLARMVKTGVSLDEARGELSIFYGHMPFGPSREIGRIFDVYKKDRTQTNQPDTLKTFEQWLATAYVPYGYRASIEAISFPPDVSASQPLTVSVRVTNTSPQAWVPGTGRGRGIKVGVRLRASDSEPWRDYDRAELGRAVAPGESRELRLTLVAPSTPGNYAVKIDLVDEFVTWFEDQGSIPLTRQLIVRGG